MSNNHCKKTVTLLSKLVLASNNASKFREFDEILSIHGIYIIPQSKLGVPQVNESFSTFIENALEKARQAAKYTGLPAIADDSGLCVRALYGAPGIYSARYAERENSGKINITNSKYLIDKLKDIDDRFAYYYCVLVLMRYADDPEPLITEGRWNGEIIDQPRGTNGFDYDPYFYLPSLNRTVAELDPAIKNNLSHRALALKSLLSRLLEEI
ncbi:MAG: RdgB/HAM1 family non-canonical purine NTP pyrophosphatase [Burkholderia sp.]|nr:RdgB/HAM1 family non-canonical purine NTP pyrophosphatase [Burkholderia sp.]